MFEIIRKVCIFSPKGIFTLIKAIVSFGINPFIIVYIGHKLYSEKIAFTFDQKDYSYNDLYHRTIKIATILQRNYRLHKRQKIGIACSNHPTHIFILFASAYLGLDIYLLNAEMSKEQISKIKEKYKFDLVVDDRFAKDLLLKDTEDKIKKVRSNFNKIVVLTSGTTGNHKTAARKSSVSDFISPFLSLIKQLKLVDYQSVYLAIPIYHGFGIITLCISFLLGARIFISRKFEAAEACRIIAENKVEAITLVPLMLHRMLSHDAVALSSLRCIISGGAALAPRLAEDTIKKLGKDKLYNIYGSSEAGISILATPKHLLYASDTIGKPLKGVDVKIVNKEGERQPIGRTGQIVIKCRWSVERDKWIETGDLGYVDENGYYFLMGRTDDMIVSGGENVYPCQLENILSTHPSVKETIVISVKDEEFGARLRAFIVSDEPALSEKDIMEWLTRRIARYQMPKQITFIEQIPLSHAGKPDKKALLTYL